MRIIAGRDKGRTIMTPKGLSTRPTGERARQALFSILGSYVLDAKVLDLFSGSGALALEALSRGAQSAVLVDKDAQAIASITRNISAMRLELSARLMPTDVFAAMARLAIEGQTFDLVFLDPPYAAGLLHRALETLSEGPLLTPESIIVAECAAEHDMEHVSGLIMVDERIYGAAKFLIYRQGVAG